MDQSGIMKVLAATAAFLGLLGALLALWAGLVSLPIGVDVVKVEVQASAADACEVDFEIGILPGPAMKETRIVELEANDGTSILLSSKLQIVPTNPRRVVIHFTADRRKLDDLQLRVVTIDRGRPSACRDIRIRDHVESSEIP